MCKEIKELEREGKERRKGDEGRRERKEAEKRRKRREERREEKKRDYGGLHPMSWTEPQPYFRKRTLEFKTHKSFSRVSYKGK